MDPVEALKAQGNKMFQVGKYAAAAVAYGDALMLLPQPPPGDRLSLASVLRSNRAMCHKALGNWDMVESDSQQAMDYDRFNAKSHYLLGLCFCRRQEWARGLASLTKAREMAARQKKLPSLLKEFEAAIAAARYEWHAASTEAESQADDSLKGVLLDALSARRDRNAHRLLALSGGQNGGSSAVPAPIRATTSADEDEAMRSGSASSSPLAPPRSAVRRYSSIVDSAMASTAQSSGGDGDNTTTQASATAADVDEDGDSIMRGPPVAAPEVQQLLDRVGQSSSAGTSGTSTTGGQRVLDADNVDWEAAIGPAPPGAQGAAAGSPAVVPQPSSTEAAQMVAPAPSRRSRELPAAVAAALDEDTTHYIACVEQLFAEREKTRRDRTVPDSFCCGITLDVMLEPVVTPSGHSYERSAIEHYLARVKQEDPRTRQPLNVSQLVPNLALKEAISTWLAEHPWAHPRLPMDATTGKVSAVAAGGGDA